MDGSVKLWEAGTPHIDEIETLEQAALREAPHMEEIAAAITRTAVQTGEDCARRRREKYEARMATIQRDLVEVNADLDRAAYATMRDGFQARLREYEERIIMDRAYREQVEGWYRAIVDDRLGVESAYLRDYVANCTPSRSRFYSPYEMDSGGPLREDRSDPLSQTIRIGADYARDALSKSMEGDFDTGSLRYNSRPPVGLEHLALSDSALVEMARLVDAPINSALEAALASGRISTEALTPVAPAQTEAPQGRVQYASLYVGVVVGLCFGMAMAATAAML